MTPITSTYLRCPANARGFGGRRGSRACQARGKQIAASFGDLREEPESTAGTRAPALLVPANRFLTTIAQLPLYLVYNVTDQETNGPS